MKKREEKRRETQRDEKKRGKGGEERRLVGERTKEVSEEKCGIEKNKAQHGIAYNAYLVG